MRRVCKFFSKASSPPSRKKAKTTRFTPRESAATEGYLSDHMEDNDGEEQEDEPEDGFAQMMAEKKSEPGGTRFAKEVGILLQQNSEFIKTRPVYHDKYYTVFFISCVENGFNPDMLVDALSSAWNFVGKRGFRFMFYLSVVLQNRISGDFRFYHSQTNSRLINRPSLTFLSPHSIPAFHKLFSTFDFQGLHYRPYESSVWQFVFVAAVELRVWVIRR